MKYPEDNRDLGKSNIEQVHLVLLRMLKILDQICKKHDIDYWLDYGTLLGAVRHNDFIPWDHEADIGMLRTDYEILRKIIVQNLPNDIFFQAKESDPLYKHHYLVEAKLRDKYSNYIEFSSKYPEYNGHNGIQVDIFVYDLDPQVPNGLTNSFERIVSNRGIYLDKEELEYTIDGKFAGHIFPIPIGYDNYLKRNYGDYMKFPPLSEQCPQYVDVFKPCKHEKVLHWKSK